MRKLPYILTLASIIVSTAYANVQDTTFNQVVTVERDYQPEIEKASIIHVKPSVLHVEVDPNPVIYSTYSAPLTIGHNLYPLQAAKLNFAVPTPTNGILDIALGHHNTFLDFDYQLNSIKNANVNVYAKHHAYWGSNTLAHTKIGGKGCYNIKNSKLYFDIEGGNSAYSIIDQQKLQALGHANVNIGFSSKSFDHLHYYVQTGYKAFLTPNVSEHQIRSRVNVSWIEGQHKGGVNLYLQNNLYTNDLKSFHNIHIEPFYELKEQNINLHVGVNLDLNVGTEQMLSATKNVSFAPSPYIQFEWLIIPEKIKLHTQVEGSLAKGSIDESMHINRYFSILDIAENRDVKTYMPVAANLGITARPLRTLLVDVYGGYSIYMNDYTMVANLDKNTSYTYLLQNYQRGHIGATVHYHYRDIVKVYAKGHYYFWKNLSSKSTVYDRPDWDASVRVSVNIDQKLSLYSENKLEGTRMALTNIQEEKLPMVIDLNIGAKYDINRWLNVYLQLGNYLNRKNPIYYGYNTQGCHFLAGMKYVF